MATSLRALRSPPKNPILPNRDNHKKHCLWVAQRFQRCDRVTTSERLLAEEVPYGRSTARQYRIQLLFHYCIYISETEPIPVRQNGATILGRSAALPPAEEISSAC